MVHGLFVGSFRADPQSPANVAIVLGRENGRVEASAILPRQENGFFNDPVVIQLNLLPLIKEIGIFCRPAKK